MFNGYHEPPGTAYNDLEADRGKKKWPCGSGTSIQSTHMYPQNHQSEIWCSKSPYIGLPNSVNTVPKCNCSSCYQLPENQSYQGDLTWHRSWLPRTYPTTMSQDLVKLQANHHWENACLPAEAYGENAGAHYVQESGDKPLYYKSYSELRHAELYQPGVISTLKTNKITKKEDFPKQDENEIGHQTRFSSSITNPGCDSFRNAVDRRRIEEESCYSNQNEKYLNMESSRQERTLGPYHLHPNRRAVLESFSKPVPSNMNQNRVPSIGHHNIKDNVFHSHIDQSSMGKVSPYNASQAVAKDKHCRSLYQPDVTKEMNPAQENMRSGLLNTLSSAPVDYHGIGFNRDFQNTLDKDFQKYMNNRNPQYLPRNNISDVIMRSCQNFVVDTRKDCNAIRKGVINSTMGNTRVTQAPLKYMEVGLAKCQTYGKFNSRDCSASGRISSDLKLIINPNGKESLEGIQKGDDIIHNHFNRPQSESSVSFASEKNYNSLPLQNQVYKGSRRPEHSYRDIQYPYDHPNGMMNLKNSTSIGINQEPIPNFSDIHNGLDSYNRIGNNLTYDGSCQQFEKMHNQIPSENKVQSSLFMAHQTSPNFFGETKKLRQSEKEESGKISHLESIRYEELCKNGTSKISPLRLLRKKKFTQPKKEDVIDTPPQDICGNSKNATSPLDVRRFWATWAEEEEDNVPQTQMIVLDCHNIDPEQAGLLHLYNPEPIRTIQLNETNVLDVKTSQLDSKCEQNLTAYRTLNFDNGSGEKINDCGKNDVENEKSKDEARKSLEESKYLSGSDLSFGMTLIIDSAKESTVNASDPKLRSDAVVVAEHMELNNNKVQALNENGKQFDIPKCSEKNSERMLDDNYASVKHRHADHVVSCDNSEVSTVLKRNDSEAGVPNENNIKEVIIDDFQRECRLREEFDHKTKELTTCSDSSDDSQTEDISTLSNLPTSEYRKNKFLDYSGDNLCNGSFSPKSVTRHVLNKEGTDFEKSKSTSDVEEKLESLTSKCAQVPKPTEMGPSDFEIGEILKKLSDINVQSPDVIGRGAELMSDIPQRLKTDKKIIDRKERKAKKLSHKSSRTDQLTLQNISLTKPTIKFSIQKSHDLKISFKVLNNKIKYDNHNSNEDKLGYRELVERGYSSEGAEDSEAMEKGKKNRRRLITLKLSEESEKSKEDEDHVRKCRKFLKKKKTRFDKSSSSKTPVLKIKKNRYMPNGCEKDEAVELCNPSDLQQISESENLNHGDFQVHETVDSAKIKLTFKRNKNNGDKSRNYSELDEIIDFKNEAAYSEYSLVTGLTLGNSTSPNENENDMKALVSPAQDQSYVLKEELKDEASVIECRVNEVEDVNLSKPYSNDEGLMEESSKIENESLNLAVDSSEMPSLRDENFLNEFERKDPQLTLPVINIYGCDKVVSLENQKDYHSNESPNQVAEDSKTGNVHGLPDYEDVLIHITEGKCINCDGILEDGGEEKSEVENYPAKEFEGEKDTINENEENVSKPDGSIKMEIVSSERDMDCDADEKFETDIDMEVSFITSLKKLPESNNNNLLNSENEDDKKTGSKSPFMPKKCNENSFTESFEKGNICTVEDTTVKESEQKYYKTGDIVEADTKVVWPKSEYTAADVCGSKKEITLSEIRDPLRELSDEKLTDDLTSIDFLDDQSEKEIRTGSFPVNSEINDTAGNSERECNTSNSAKGCERVCEIHQGRKEEEKHSENKNDPEINDSRSITDYNIDRKTGAKMLSPESNQENIRDITNVLKAASVQEDFAVASQGTFHVSHYLRIIDDNNNNNNSTNNNNNNNHNNSNSNNNHRLLQNDNIFVKRTVFRRCSYEDRTKSQEQGIKKRCRSQSLNINITLPESSVRLETIVKDFEPQVPLLDIPVSDIPLPPGDAPPENCLHFEEYIRCNLVKNSNYVNFENDGDNYSSQAASCTEKRKIEISESKSNCDFPLMLESQSPEDLLSGKEFEEISSFVETPVTKESNEEKCSEVLSVIDEGKPDINAEGMPETKGEEKVDLCELVSTVMSSDIACKETPAEISEDICELKLSESCLEYSENVNVAPCAQGVEIDLGESSFKTGGLYECGGLAFDEALTIADDIEEEKVADDDKFRNIMQNCLDNAKKFLSVGNLKLFSCSRDDLLEIDYYEDQSQDKKQENHVSKDVLLASCEKSANEDLVLVDHHSSDISVDFVPSFCSDAGSSLCPEILPVDNWPYLEEEVASSPLRNKQEDSDFLSACMENNLSIEDFPSDKWNLLNESDSEYVGERLKNKSRAASVCVTEGSALFKTTERSLLQRRRTIEGIGRWKSFHNSNEELKKSENFLETDDVDEEYQSNLEGLSLKNELTVENMKYSKKSRDMCRDKLKKRTLPYGVIERCGKSLPNMEKIRSEKAKLEDRSARNSPDFKSSLWQPKVVLFRISKNMIEDLSTLPKRSIECDSLHKAQMDENKNIENKNVNIQKQNESDDMYRISKTNKCMKSVREYSVGKTTGSEFHGCANRFREVLPQDFKKQPKSEITSDSATYGVKRKKSRFRNLHTKKRIVPDAFDLTKDKSATKNNLSLVDSEESSPERVLPKPAVFSQCKSTKSVSPTKSDELHKNVELPRAPVHRLNIKTERDEEALKAKRKYKESDRQKSLEIDSSRHSYKSGDNKRKRENYESKYEIGSRRKKERSHTRENDRTGYVEIGVRKSIEHTSKEKTKNFDLVSDRETNSKSQNRPKQRYWKCEVCGFSRSSDRAIHIQSHPFHCQSCHLAFKAETNFLDHLTRKHKDIRNQHHCLLCELSFDLENDYYHHLETREHKHLESVEKNTINTLFTLLTGHPCPVLGPVESKPEWLPTQAGTVHFYHQATPLSLALQYLKLHRDKTATLSAPIE